MKQRQFLLVIIFFFSSGIITAQNFFSIVGTVKKISSGYLYLTYQSTPDLVIIDSSRISPSGKFFFKGTIQHPVSAVITIYNEPTDVSDVNFTSFFISP